MSHIQSNTWRDDPAGASYGPGVSRPANGARVRTFRVKVKPPHQNPIILTLQAETKVKAKRYAKNRWPGAEVQLLT